MVRNGLWVKVYRGGRAVSVGGVFGACSFVLGFNYGCRLRPRSSGPPYEVIRNVCAGARVVIPPIGSVFPVVGRAPWCARALPVTGVCR